MSNMEHSMSAIANHLPASKKQTVWHFGKLPLTVRCDLINLSHEATIEATTFLVILVERLKFQLDSDSNCSHECVVWWTSTAIVSLRCIDLFIEWLSIAEDNLEIRQSVKSIARSPLVAPSLEALAIASPVDSVVEHSPSHSFSLCSRLVCFSRLPVRVEGEARWSEMRHTKTEREREKDLFETQSKEQVLSSDQLFKSIYSCFLIDVAVVSTTRTKLSHVDGREKNRAEKKTKRARAGRRREMQFLQCVEPSAQRERGTMIRSWVCIASRAIEMESACAQRWILRKYFYAPSILFSFFSSLGLNTDTSLFLSLALFSLLVY